MYSSSFKDAMIQVGDTWIRASQIETIQKKSSHNVGPRHFEGVTIGLISGRTVELRLEQGEADKIAGMAVGQP